MTPLSGRESPDGLGGAGTGQQRECGRKRRRRQNAQRSPAQCAAILQAAQAAGRQRDTSTSARSIIGWPPASARNAREAVARKILVIVYHILTRHEPYRELGVTTSSSGTAKALERRLVRRLEALGNHVELHHQETAA